MPAIFSAGIRNTDPPPEHRQQNQRDNRTHHPPHRILTDLAPVYAQSQRTQATPRLATLRPRHCPSPPCYIALIYRPTPASKRPCQGPRHDQITPTPQALDWLEAELADAFDEAYELELEDAQLSLEISKIYKDKHPDGIDRHVYFQSLIRLQSELIKLQDWVSYHKKKVVVLFEGRDSAGKGGVIKRISQRLNPRVVRVVALPAPSDREKTQWYFQRYVPHLPAGGEIVLFDRSWYNRAGVERVMGFAGEDQVEQFFHDVPEFERMLVRSGITVIKYWFSITDEEQQMRFLMRIHDPMKQWKLSPMDLQSPRALGSITPRPKKK